MALMVVVVMDEIESKPGKRFAAEAWALEVDHLRKAMENSRITSIHFMCCSHTIMPPFVPAKFSPFCPI